MTLEEIKKTVDAFESLAREAKFNVPGNFSILIISTIWKATYEICSRLESSQVTRH